MQTVELADGLYVRTFFACDALPLAKAATLMQQARLAERGQYVKPGVPSQWTQRMLYSVAQWQDGSIVASIRSFLASLDGEQWPMESLSLPSGVRQHLNIPGSAEVTGLFSDLPHHLVTEFCSEHMKALQNLGVNKFFAVAGQQTIAVAESVGFTNTGVVIGVPGLPTSYLLTRIDVQVTRAS